MTTSTTDTANQGDNVALNPVPMEDRVIHRSTDTGDYKLLIEPTPRWIRVMFNGVTVADSKRALIVDESKHMPVYYFPVEDVRDDLLQPGTMTRDFPVKGTATYHSIEVNGRRAENACWTFDDPDEEIAQPLKGYLAFYWHKMDHWFEEDEEVFVHPRDPRHRVDVCASSRHVQIIVGGQVVAETHRPRLLFETNLPTRYYIPVTDVRMDLLVDSPTVSQCPYKGVAAYYNVRVGDGKAAKDVAWYYRFPLAESVKIENLICFFNERVDAIIVDGEEIEKPKTPWSKKPVLIDVD